MDNSCILFTFFSLFPFFQWKLPADGRAGEYKEARMKNFSRKAL